MPPIVTTNVNNTDDPHITIIEVTITTEETKQFIKIDMYQHSDQSRETSFSSSSGTKNMNNTDFEEILECFSLTADEHCWVIPGITLILNESTIMLNECQYKRTPEFNTSVADLFKFIKIEQNKLVNKNMIHKMEKYCEELTTDVAPENFRLFHDNCPEASDEFKTLFESTSMY